MKYFPNYLLSLLLALMPVLSFPLARVGEPKQLQDASPTDASAEDDLEISPQAQRQMEALLAQKHSRSPEQRKLSTNLIVAAQQESAPSSEASSAVQVELQIDELHRALVDIRGRVTADVLEKIQAIEGEVIFSSEPDESIRARIPLSHLEELAGLSEIDYIEAAVGAATHRELNPAGFDNSANVALPFGSPNFAQRATALKTKLTAALAARSSHPMTEEGGANAIVTGPPFSQGDRAHQADALRNLFGFDGTGLRIGVLSDSVRYLEQSQASGNLPLDVTVVPGQSGIVGTSLGAGEGTAMLEIIHDLAPGAKLFYATALSANSSDASFAQNIRTLRFTYRCDIIVDDIFYFNEHPFQDAVIARAVNDVTADGALYFASAGNEGNINDGTSGVWEGDYLDGGTLTNLPDAGLYRIHSFGERLISNRIAATSQFGYALFWADPWGRSTNDYDLFILDSTLSRVKGASLGDQSGTQPPYEFIGTKGIAVGDRIVIANFRAEPRALHLNLMRGRLAVNTRGQTRGHGSAVNAFSVAAVNAALAGGGAFVGGTTNPVETFSSDGPRRLFFNPDGTPIVPGNFLFATNGGTVREKPDIAAADGVSTSVPGFTTFFGTSAAAPHAAAIAALLKSAAPQLTNAQVRELLMSTALDVGPLGWDRTAGIGIVTALGSYLAYAPTPLLAVSATEVQALEGDGDRFVEPGETARLDVSLFNSGNSTATDLQVTLASTTPGVTVVNARSDYFPIAAGKAGTNLAPFTLQFATSVTCGARVDLVATVSSQGQPPRTLNFAINTGQPAATAQTFTYAGAPVAIPDGNANGVLVRLPISGLTSSISNVRFRINGDNCGVESGTGLQHPWVGDLTLRLISPTGTVVTLMSAPGSSANFGRNFCNTVLDDTSTRPIQTVNPALNYTGTFRPASPLAAFIGENGNGNWTLQAIDASAGDAGTLRSFSILITTYDCVRGTSVVEASVSSK